MTLTPATVRAIVREELARWRASGRSGLSPDSASRGPIHNSNGHTRRDEQGDSSVTVEFELSNTAAGSHQGHELGLNSGPFHPVGERPGLSGVHKVRVHVDLRSSSGRTDEDGAAGAPDAPAAPVRGQA